MGVRCTAEAGQRKPDAKKSPEDKVLWASSFEYVEREKRLELSTSTLARLRSTN
jgi:hypothetical protein